MPNTAAQYGTTWTTWDSIQRRHAEGTLTVSRKAYITWITFAQLDASRGPALDPHSHPLQEHSAESEDTRLH